MLLSLYHASTNFGRTYLSQDFGWIIYITKSKPPQPVSFPCHCKEQRWNWAVSSAHVTEKIGTILIQKGAFSGIVLSKISKQSFDTCII